MGGAHRSALSSPIGRKQRFPATRTIHRTRAPNGSRPAPASRECLGRERGVPCRSPDAERCSQNRRAPTPPRAFDDASGRQKAYSPAVPWTWPEKVTRYTNVGVLSAPPSQPAVTSPRHPSGNRSILHGMLVSSKYSACLGVSACLGSLVMLSGNGALAQPVLRELSTGRASISPTGGFLDQTSSDSRGLRLQAQAPYSPPPYGNGAYAAPPPPQRPEGSGVEVPDFSIRIDPFNWLLEGRLGLELEVELTSFLTVEMVPVFVASEQPPSLNLGGIPDTLHQRSNGLGAMSGASAGLGFWLEGDTLEGTVIRAIITNYAYTYAAEDDAGTIDEVSHTERQLYGMIGSHARWKAFTIAGGIGLGVELNKQSRCPDGLDPSDCDDSELLLRIDRSDEYVNLNSSLYPAVIHGRISLGVVF